jgi:hypothetical protein
VQQALLFVHAGASAVYGEIMSESADRFLTAEGIPHAAGEIVPHIINRSGSGICPMEEKAAQCSSPRDAWERFNSLIN